MAKHNASGVEIVPGDTVEVVCMGRSKIGVVSYADCEQFKADPEWMIEVAGPNGFYWKQRYEGGTVEKIDLLIAPTPRKTPPLADLLKLLEDARRHADEAAKLMDAFATAAGNDDVRGTIVTTLMEVASYSRRKFFDADKPRTIGDLIDETRAAIACGEYE